MPSAAARSWRSTSPPASRWPSPTIRRSTCRRSFRVEENYNAVKDAENEPLFNRALLGQYSPGSTFKPCTAIAGLTEGVITTGTAHPVHRHVPQV